MRATSTQEDLINTPDKQESKNDLSSSDIKESNFTDENISCWFFFSDPLLAKYYFSFKITSTPYKYTWWMMLGLTCYFIIYWTLVLLVFPHPFAYTLMALTIILAILPISFVCLLRRGEKDKQYRRSAHEPIQQRLAWLESFTVLGFVAVFSLIHIMRSSYGQCVTQNFAEIWHCLPAIESGSMISETVLILLMLPLLFSIILPHVSFVVILVATFISIGVTVITSGFLSASGSSTWVFFLVVFLLVIQFFYQRQHMELFLFTWRYRQSIQARERDRRIQETKLATEMRNMVASVSHDLKSPLAAFVCGVELVRDLVRERNSGSDETPRKKVTKSSFSSICTSASFDGTITTLPTSQDFHAIYNNDFLTNIKRALAGIESSYYLLLMTVNRSTDYTKCIHGIPLVPEWEFVIVGEVVSKAIQIISCLQQEVVIQLRQNFHEGLLTDRQWLLDNLLGLVSNSLKYSTEAGDIQVLVSKYSCQQLADNIALQKSFSYFVHVCDNLGAEESTDWVHIEICDSGRGLTSQAATNIFQAPDFSSQRTVGGSGLGLYCLGKRVETLGGCYGVSPRTDKQSGSVFWFSMPIRTQEGVGNTLNPTTALHPDLKELSILRDEEVKSASFRVKFSFDSNMFAEDTPVRDGIQMTVSAITAKKTSSEETKQEEQNKIGGNEDCHDKDHLRILLVDDSLPIQKMLRLMLERNGYKVETASNGRDALYRLFGGSIDHPITTATQHGHTFDVVLMDLQMPEMDGFDAIRFVRNREAGGAGGDVCSEETVATQTLALDKRQLILAMSANSDSATRLDALKAGADFFIPKPFKMEMFYDALQSCWEHHQH